MLNRVRSQMTSIVLSRRSIIKTVWKELLEFKLMLQGIKILVQHL